MTEIRAWRASRDGLRLRVRATARAGRDAIEGFAALPDGPALKVAVAAPPEDGKANAAILRLLSKRFGLPRSALTIAGGERARLKTVAIAGEAPALARALDALSAEAGEA